MTASWLLSLIGGVSGTLVFLLSLRFSRKNQFYSDTPWLWPWGVFVWGDGLVLGPFWIVLSGVWWALFRQDHILDPWIWVARSLLLFWIVRSGVEVVYWLNHQAAQKEYAPPFLRNVKWLNQDQAAILYQLTHTSILVVLLLLLLLSWVW